MAAATTMPPRKGRQWGNQLAAAGFLLPGTILLLAFLIVPFALAISYSFTNLRLISPLPSHFVGWLNFQRALANPLVRQAFGNNVLFVIVVVPVQTVFALWLAILVNQKIRGIKIFRTIFFAPVVTVMAAAATIWKLLYEPDAGLINGFMKAITFGQFHPNWLHDPHFALPAIMLMSIWQGVGFQMIIILAGLQGVPAELYEAASVDGANGWTQFLNITLPELRNTLIFVGTITTILAFRLFDQVFVLTQGGPVGSTETLMTRVITTGFGQQRIGASAAIAVLFFIIVLVLSLAQRIFIREEGEAV